jgi:hypothetical protein
MAVDGEEETFEDYMKRNCMNDNTIGLLVDQGFINKDPLQC